MNLDDLIPDPQYRICHSRVVGAPPGVVWDELHEVTMSALPLGRALEAVRLLPARLSGRKHQPLARRSFLEVTPIPVLFSERPVVVISAGLSQLGASWEDRLRRLWTPRACAAGRDPDGSRSGWSFASNPPGWARSSAPRPASSQRMRGPGGPSLPTGSSSARAAVRFVARYCEPSRTAPSRRSHDLRRQQCGGSERMRPEHQSGLHA
jgi:hypothetical protein